MLIRSNQVTKETGNQHENFRKRLFNKTSYSFPKSAFWEYLSYETQQMQSRYLPIFLTCSGSEAFLQSTRLGLDKSREQFQ